MFDQVDWESLKVNMDNFEFKYVDIDGIDIHSPGIDMVQR
jgi:hypothetical protein